MEAEEPLEIERVKRPLFCYFFLEDHVVFDVEAFLSGDLEVSSQSRLSAFSVCGRSARSITQAELRFLATLSSSRWTPVAALADVSAGVRLADLLSRGLLLSDGAEPAAARIRACEESLASRQWSPQAAFYHFWSRLSEDKESSIDVRALRETAAADADAWVERFGTPPPPFHSRGGASIELPLDEKRGGLYDVLLSRKTARAFDSSRPLKLQDLSTLLRYVFGCHGQARLSDVQLLHKTSPSGGSLHPIEAYPLILDVEKTPAGLYHYDPRAHALELLTPLEESAARKLAVELSGGQQYAGSAHALILMTARFLRNHWKYRRRSRTYAVILMDAGHLSQTFYLVAADLGLGAFYTAAINGRRIEEVLGLEPADEGAIGICGCGVKTQRDSMGLDFRPFTPRRDHP